MEFNEETHTRDVEEIDQLVENICIIVDKVADIKQSQENVIDKLEDLKEADFSEITNQKVLTVDRYLSTSFKVNKQDVASGPGIIFSKDGNTIFNCDAKCPPIPYCDFETKVMPQRLLVYPASRHNVLHVQQEAVSSRMQLPGSDDVRRDIIIYILSIVGIQLFITFGFMFICVLVEPLSKFVMAKLEIVYILFAVQLLIFIIFVCADVTRKKTPYNYVLEVVFTLITAYLLAYITTKYSTKKNALISFAITMGIFGSVIALAWLNLCDFTHSFFAIDILLISGIIFYLVASIYYWFTKNRILLYIFYCVFLLIMYLSLFHEMELIFGQRKYAVNKNEHVIISIILLLEILVIFTLLLNIIVGP